MGYFSPVNETPDGKLDGSTETAPRQSRTSTAGSQNSNNDNQGGNTADRFNRYGWFKKLSPESKALIIDAFDKKN